jgi:orotate phosphoribosyltransferase
MGGIPVVTALSHHTGLPCAFVRKHPKPYGTRLLAEGAGIHAALCVIDRQQGGAPALLAEGITLLSLLTATDLNATA